MEDEAIAGDINKLIAVLDESEDDNCLDYLLLIAEIGKLRV